MKRYKWIKDFRNWNNRGYHLQDTVTKQNVAWISEDNYCKYTINTNDYPMSSYRYTGTLEDAMSACLNTKGISADDVEVYTNA